MDARTGEVIARPGPSFCPWCGSALRIDPLRIGRYVCTGPACGESLIEDPADELTWAENVAETRRRLHQTVKPLTERQP